MSRGSDDHDRLIWRFLRDAGGWHSAREIACELALDARGKMRLAHALRRLKAGAHVVERLDACGVATYGVTAMCWPPSGESLVPDEALPVFQPVEGG